MRNAFLLKEIAKTAILLLILRKYLEIMKTITAFKTLDDNLEVEYEVLSPIEMTSSSIENEEILKHIKDVEYRINNNQAVIDKINAEIDKLTNHADGYDYALAACSGVLCGLIDSFFVGEFSLDEGTQWGKEKVDSFVKKVAEKKGYTGNSLEGAVKFLEGKFPIPADSATALFGGGTQHHLRDFSHHPTPVGLIFSLLTQFTGKVYGTNTLGAFILADVPDTALIGKDLPSKIAIGFVNWIFHMVSDIAGSSGSIVQGKYGTGLPGPFVSLLKELSSLPIFSHDKDSNEFCIWISKLFNGTLLKKRDENGRIIPDSVIKFDLRAELGTLYELGKQAIPVIINECIVRVYYFARRLSMEFKSKEINSFQDFIHKINWESTLPFKNRTIVRMMTIASGTFVAVDLTDAAIRSALKSGGEAAAFFANLVLRINFVGIGRFAVAIGSDVYMGHKKGNLESERLYRMSEQILLYNCKIFYKEADMWEAAKNASEAIDKLEEYATAAGTCMKNDLAEILEGIRKISKDLEQAEEKNPGISEEITNILKYGK